MSEAKKVEKRVIDLNDRNQNPCLRCNIVYMFTVGCENCHKLDGTIFGLDETVILEENDRKVRAIY